MNPKNPLCEYATLLNEYGVKLVRQFTKSEEYAELHLKIAKIDADIWKTEQEYREKIRELRAVKRNIEINEIPKAKDAYVRKHIEAYKEYLNTEKNK